MKTYSAESVSTAETDSLKPGNGRVGARRASSLPSSGEDEKLGVLRDLKPRFLEGLTPTEGESVLALAKYREARANSLLTHQDDPAMHLFLLLTGRARYFFVTEKGQKVILLWIPPGEIFGVAALLEMPAGYHVSVEAVRDSTLLMWDRAAIRSLAAKYPKLFENALYRTLHYLAAYRAAHSALISETAQERLAHVLLSLAGGFGEKVGGGVELKIRNEELANEANITLFTTSRLLNQWQRAGILSKGRGKILLRSPERLLRHGT